jgi:RNA polymerase sigma-70 factor (ECF subfamily)
VQETIISVAKNIEDFRYDPKVCSFKTWMLNLTRWRIINQLKRRAKAEVHASACPAITVGGTLKRELQPESADTIEAIPDPASFELDAIWEAEWERSLLAAATERVKRQVSPEQFQIFDLYCIENWPVKKVAQTLRVSATKVYLAKHRIARLLKRQIEMLRRGDLPRV